jgi:protoporphyrinogen oxidase
MKTTILGAGISGLSTSYHLEHKNCVIFEKNSYSGGLLYSENKNDCWWDLGPHVSFTKSEYVREIFSGNDMGTINEIPVKVGNYYEGHWMPHPVQTNLFSVPQQLRNQCMESFLNTEENDDLNEEPKHYGEWLRQAFGSVFADSFPAVYTEKYWTVPPENLTTDWVGKRMYAANKNEIVQGFKQAPASSQHYIKTVRYPMHGGYNSFLRGLTENANIQYNKKIIGIDLSLRKISFNDGTFHNYDRLVSTLPLPDFIKYVKAPEHIIDAANQLLCTSALLVNVTAEHAPKIPYHWFYVYDKSMISTRITNIGLLSPNNVPEGKTGLQVEVYSSSQKPFEGTIKEMEETVCNELISMGAIDKVETVHSKILPYANVVFCHNRREKLDIILGWLENFDLERHSDDLEPMTDWKGENAGREGSVILAGRHAQWKYYWSDDCLLRGKQIAERLSECVYAGKKIIGDK